MKYIKALSLLIISLFVLPQAITAQKKTAKKSNIPPGAILRYNNPSLEVDLGVGLWGIPLPVDYDSDGLKDLLVSCPDRPYKGLWFFKNIGSKKSPKFAKAVKINDKGLNNIRMSEVNVIPYVLSKDS